jgi:hypothetical protein
MSDRDAISYSLTVEHQYSAGPPKAVVTRYRLFLRGEVDHVAQTQSKRSPDKDVRNCFGLVGEQVRLIVSG